VAALAIDQMIENKEVIIPGKWNRFFLAIDRMLPKVIKEKLIELQMKTYSTRPALQFISSSNSFNLK